ncbi:MULTISPECIES: transposase [unclassified Microcoleus]|uniref:transposase n=1 Tax=unclassified Microcoleus TaxID=2642155 RepID=UPI002FD4664F
MSGKNLTRRAKPKTDVENGNLVYLPNGQSAKSGLNKSMLDAAHGQFAIVLKYVAWKLGKSILFVDPKGTSQHCWNCLNKVPKGLSERWHSCLCGESLDRDENSAKLIKKIGLSYESGGGTPSLKKAFKKKEKEACGLTVIRLPSGSFTEYGRYSAFWIDSKSQDYRKISVSLIERMRAYNTA